MANTFTSLHYHTVFSTKDRQPTLAGRLPEIHEYLGACIRQLGGTALRVGGIDDHIHSLMRLKPTHSVADVLREIKSASSRWLHEWMPSFSWQDGYAAFTVSPSQLDRVYRYIEGQAQHHSRMKYEDELRELLTAHGIAFDERYLL